MRKGVARGASGSVMPTDIPNTWRAMEALYDSGKARALGVCNFSSKKLGDLLDIARVPPAVDQVECHPVWQQHKLREFCKSKGVHLSVSCMFFFMLEIPYLITIMILKCRKRVSAVTKRSNVTCLFLSFRHGHP